MRIKKLISALLVVAMSFSLVACGGESSKTNDSTSTSKSNDSTSNSESKSNSDSEVKISTVKIVAVASGDVTDAAEVQAKINEILATKGLAVELTYINFGSWATQTNLLLTGEKGAIDLLPLFITPFATFVNNGQVLPMDDLIAEYGQGISEVFTEDQMNAGKMNGVTYGITTSRDLAASYGFAYRADIAEELKLDMDSITTLEGLTAALETVHAAYPELYTVVPQSGATMVEKWNWDNFSDNYNLGVIMDPGNSTDIVNLYETNEFKEFCNITRDWYQKGFVMPDALSNTETAANICKAGKAFGWLTNTKPGYGEENTRNTGYEIKVVDLLPAFSTTGNTSGLLWAIANNSSDPAAAMQVLTEMYINPEVANLLINGLEEKNYVYTDDTKTMISYPEGVDGSTTGYPNLGWAWPNQFITPVWEPNDADYWEQMKDFNNTAIPSKALGFIVDTSVIVNEVTACTNVATKYRDALMTGTVDVDSTLEIMNADLQDAGIDKIIETKQTQLDAWLTE